MKRWTVVVPIAGHAEVCVEAESEEAAISRALDEATLEDFTGWESMRQFNQGNYCFCPQPWEAEAIAEDDEKEPGVTQ